MALQHHPRIVTSGLVLYTDPANTKSYSGSGTALTDISNSGLACSTVNSPTYSSTNTGIFTFNGSSQYLNLTNNSLVQITSGTITAWVKSSTNDSNYRGIVVKQFAYSMFLRNGNLTIYDWQLPGERNSSTSIADGTWKYVALTFANGVTNGSNSYVNGIGVSTFTFNISSASSQSLYGAADPNSSQYLNGSLGLIKVYNRALSAAEILQNYNASKGRYL